MKKRIAILLAAVCALSLCFALAGCGGGSADDGKKNFTGNWKLVEGEAGGEALTADDLAAFEELGMTITLDLKEDGSCVLDMLGAEMTGTWEAKDASTADVTLDGSKTSANISGDKLTISVGEDSLTFQKA